MINIYEVLRRSEQGPYIKENDFDMKLYRTTTRLVKEYGIKFDRERPVVSDDQMAKGMFEAGMKLALEMNVPLEDFDHIRRGAILVAEADDAAAAGIQRFNALLAADPRVTATILPTAGRKGFDGLALAWVR